jgi:hypothetical protein
MSAALLADTRPLAGAARTNAAAAQRYTAAAIFFTVMVVAILIPRQRTKSKGRAGSETDSEDEACSKGETESSREPSSSRRPPVYEISKHDSQADQGAWFGPRRVGDAWRS